MEKPSGFRDKVALIVGDASGMGNAIVRQLMDEDTAYLSSPINTGYSVTPPSE